jgi:hypothetical protein
MGLARLYHALDRIAAVEKITTGKLRQGVGQRLRVTAQKRAIF